PSGTKKGTQTSLFAPLGVEMSCLIRILVAASVWGVSVGLMRLISVAISRENQPLSMFVMSFVIGGIYAGRLTTELWQDPLPRRAQRMWMLLTALGALFGFVFDLFWGLTEIRGSLGEVGIAFAFGAVFGVIAEILSVVCRQRQAAAVCDKK